MMSTKASFCMLLAGVTLCAGGILTAHASYGPGFESYKMPEAAWLTEADTAGASGRNLLATLACTIKITGTGKKFGVKAASIKCTGGTVTLFAGRPLVNYQKANPSSFSNVNLQLPNEPNFLGTNNTEPALFLVQRGKISLTGYVRSLSLVDWAAIVVEDGTQATVSNFEFTKNNGVRFPTLAVSRGSATVFNSTWTSNTCTSKTRCHTPGIYVTEGARVTVSNSEFTSNQGHLAGAIMITSGALGTVTSNTFTGNSCVNNGDFGGAIFHDLCTDPRTNGGKSTFRSNKFINNKTQGFGGAMCIGSPQGGCKPTISSNTFTGNTAKYTGGAIYFRYCGSKVPYLSKNTFSGNSATMFNGQIGYNPKTKPSKQGGGSSGTAGCSKPTSYKNAFSGSVPSYSPAWFFP